jgi:hypothetical protein
MGFHAGSPHRPTFHPNRKQHNMIPDDKILLDIYLDGFMSGATTAISNFMTNNTDLSDLMAHTFVVAVTNDEATMAVVRQHIQDRLDGKDDSDNETVTIKLGGEK